MRLKRFITTDELEFLEANIRSFNFESYNNYYGVANKKDQLSKNNLKQLEKINELLKNVIDGFESFSGFVYNEKNKIYGIRFQYNYNYNNDGASFSGVGYISLSELKEGFKND